MQDEKIEFLKISFCTVCMNRALHLKETFIKNILDNISYPRVEFNLLNYNSNDDLEVWIMDNLKNYIASGTLRYFRTYEPTHFDRSHSRNMIFKLASGDILCNLDADNYLGKDFAFYVNMVLNVDRRNMLIKKQIIEFEADRNTFGRICIKRDDFYQVRGFDEKMKGYGFEDTDIVNRLQRSGVEPEYIVDRLFLDSISHSDTIRIANEEFTSKVIKILLRYVNHYSSEIVVLFKDSMFERVLIVDNFLLQTLLNNRFKKYDSSYDVILAQNNYEIGQWETTINSNLIFLPANNLRKRILKWQNDSQCYKFRKKTYHCISSGILFDQILFLLPQIKNRNLMEYNKTLPSIVNSIGFGKGTVVMNFSDEPIFLE